MRLLMARSIAADSDFHARANGEWEARKADGADVLLIEKIVELGEDGYVAGDSDDGVEVELGIAEVEIAVGEKKEVSVGGAGGCAGVVELECRVVAAAGERAFDRGGKSAGSVLSCEETGVRWSAEGTAANEGRNRSYGNAGDVGVRSGYAVRGCSGVEAEGLFDERDRKSVV